MAAVRAWHWKMRAELLLAAAMIGGWMLVTYALAAIVRPRIMWPMSIGLLMLSASGWKLLGEIATKGCYVLNVRAQRNAGRGS